MKTSTDRPATTTTRPPRAMSWSDRLPSGGCVSRSGLQGGSSGAGEPTVTMARVDQFLLLSDARVAAVRVADNGEPLVDLQEQFIVVNQRTPDRAQVLARRGVAARLGHAAAQLPARWRLVIAEAYRPPDLQRRYFEDHIDFLVSRHPTWSWEELVRQASCSICPPEIAPHVTGGAVHLSVLDGGSPGHLDQLDELPAGDDRGCPFPAPLNLSSQDPRRWSALAKAMTAAGFVNYPTKWWHWSYGDRYWAFRVGAPAAPYGAVSAERPRQRP